MTKAMLAVSVSATALAMVAAMPAAAQTASAVDNSDIVVTAQKREQRLLDVPVSISAVSSEALTTQGLNRTADFFERVPGLQYSGQRVSALSIRGITTGGGTTPTVALLVDDIQFGGSTNKGQPPIPDFDASAISRVEVLRGPQGTLYGASSLGGIIKYVLKEPSTDEFSGRVELGGTTVSGGGSGYSARGSVNVPLTDWLAVTGSGFYREDAPYLDNANAAALKSSNVNTRKVWGFRGAVLAKPTDSLTVTLSALRQKQDAVNSDLAVTSAGVPICVACTPATKAGAATATTTFEPVYGDMTINALDSYNESTFALYSGKAEYDFGGATLTSITAWSRADNVISNDVTTTFPFLRVAYADPTATTVIANADRTHKFSQEVRLAGDTPWFTWLLGGFYTVEHAATDQTLFVSKADGTALATPYVSAGPGVYREKAAFADVTFHLSDRLDVQIGGRVSGNTQNNASSYVIDTPATPYFGVTRTVSARSSDSAFTWVFSPSYKITDDIMVYGRIATGYRPGGANIGTVSGVSAFKPDRVVNYELGMKGRVIPGVTVMAAAFQIDWEDIQLQGTDASSNLTYIGNGGKARSRGIEFQTNVTPWTGMTVDANFTVTDAELTETLPDLGASSLVGQKGDRLPFTSKFTASVTALQSFTLTDRLDASLGGTFSHIGDRAAAFNLKGTTRPRILIPAYSTLTLQGGLTFDQVWSATLFVRNVTDTRGITVAQNRNGANVPTALFIQPRTFGLTLARSF
ncbi:MAG: TonB-dependent receptor [Sphingomonas sp.]|nr:MAG: TonB-dependent receptor [Sphingomonas sp.]